MAKASVKKRQTATKKVKSNDLDTLVLGATAVSVVLTAWFIFSVFAVGQRQLSGAGLGTPNVYAAWAALLLSAFSWVNSKNEGVRHVLISTFVALTTALLIWLFGMTDAGIILGY